MEIIALGRTAGERPPRVCKAINIPFARFSRFLDGESCLTFDEIARAREYLTDRIRQQVTIRGNSINIGGIRR